jgi:hypothetical protein
MGLVLKKREGETWREAALRQAKKHRMESKVAQEYDHYLSCGHEPCRAAWCACYEWDVLDFIDEPVSN